MVDHLRHRLRDRRIARTLLRDLRRVVLLHLRERERRVDLVPLLREEADEREVRHDEARGRLRHDVLAEEPVHEAVVELAFVAFTPRRLVLRSTFARWT